MGWTIYLIIISNASSINPTDIPQKIGLSHLKPIKEISMGEAQYINGISIGKFGDKIFIVSDDLVFKFYDPSPSEFEKRVCDSFPNSEIAALALYSTVDLYGYNIIKDGKRERVKSGSDLDLYVDIGDKIPEELSVSKEKLFDDNELKGVKEDMAKRMRDQEISIRTTFRLTRRYFGKGIDEKGSDFEKIILTLYK
jgi:hypothetical protein